MGDPAANLLLAVGEDTYDLLIVGAHQRHGLARVLNGSVAGRVARHAARTPVVCVPTMGSERATTGRAPTIPTIRTVLAATDLSELGNAAVPHAYALLRATGGVVELCHVHEHGLPHPAYAYDEPSRLTAAERAALVKELRALVPPEAEKLGITTHVSVIDGGKAAEAIVQAAERFNVDAISLAPAGGAGWRARCWGPWRLRSYATPPDPCWSSAERAPSQLSFQVELAWRTSCPRTR